jgi:WD40 repeat protein
LSRGEGQLSHSTESLAIHVWRASDGALVKDALPVREVLIGSVSLAPNGAYYTMQRADHRIEFWSVASGQQISITATSIAKGDAYSPAIDGAWSRDGAFFAIALPNPTWPAGPTEIQVWSTATGKVAQSLSESDSFQGMIEALAWSPDGRYLAESSGAIHIWDVAAQKMVATFGAITTRTTSSDGKTTAIS